LEELLKPKLYALVIGVSDYVARRALCEAERQRNGSSGPKLRGNETFVVRCYVGVLRGAQQRNTYLADRG
jgi:hypothetical protein